MRLNPVPGGLRLAAGAVAGAGCAAAIVLAVHPGGAGGATPALKPTAARTDGTIAFVRGGPGVVMLPGEIALPRDLGIVKVDVATGDERRLTPVGVLAEAPAWSPDGRTITFARYVRRDSGPAVTVIGAQDANSGRQRRLVACRPPDCEGDGSPAFSPDGSRLAFRRLTRHGGKIFVARANGKAPKLVSPLRTLSVYGAPSWSRDGSALAFSAYRHGGNTIDVYIVDATGRRLHRVRGCASSGCGVRYTGAAWSPAADELAAERRSGGGIDLITPVGKVIRSLTNCPTGCEDTAPAFSPDGRYVAFARKARRGPAAIYLVRRDGTGLRRVTRFSDIACCPAWRPGVR